MAPNERAIREWIKVNRPDLTRHQVDGIFENQALFFIASMAFAAGTDFKALNPQAGSILFEPESSYSYDFKRI
jgi:hypothetical protein